MIYENNTYDAVMELERQRTGNYGLDADHDYKEETCEHCGCNAEFEVEGHSYCLECLSDEVKSATQELLDEYNNRDEFSRAVKKMLSDYLEDADTEGFCADHFHNNRF